jgi:UDP-N-acetylmuramoyl-tripeptide--D-alanyl-D-alanine ligase
VTTAAPARVIFAFPAIASSTGGRAIAAARRDITSVASDSRNAGEGCLFIALPGERTDGHRYLDQAASNGAAALLVSEEWAQAHGAECAALAARHGTGVVAVRDTLAALQDLARGYMRGLPAMTRIGVTGSNGKTTTKEIIGSLLSRSAPTAMNAGNLNSEIGLPLACFAVAPHNRYAIFEMGMNRAGEMDILADIVRPDLALVTNIGAAHIGMLGSQDAIAAEKKKVFSHFDGRQTGFIPEGERYAAFLTRGVPGRFVSFGPKSTPGYRGSESMGLGGTLIHWEGFRIRFPLFGPHNLANALGAVSVARELGVPNAEIRDGLEAVTPLFGRSQVLRGAVTAVVDCYNANPDSMERALEFITTLPWEGRRIAVLGGMRELGEELAPAHAALGRSLGSSGLDAVFLLGEEMEHAWKAMAGAPLAGRSAWFTDIEALSARLAEILQPGDLLLLKGSRGLEMERLLPRITQIGREAPRNAASGGAPGAGIRDGQGGASC